MPAINGFHEVRFPSDISLGSAGGPQRRTEIVTLGSGREQRNARWSDSRRHYNAGYGIKTLDDLCEVIAFFEQRRGRLFGFRFKDPVDYKSTAHKQLISAVDQEVGIGDGTNTVFQLTKKYGSGEGEWLRKITKPVANTVLVSVDGIQQVEGSDYSLDPTTGKITFLSNHVPQQGAHVHAGFEFDVPVRFDTDDITVNMTSFMAGDIAAIPLVEIIA